MRRYIITVCSCILITGSVVFADFLINGNIHNVRIKNVSKEYVTKYVEASGTSVEQNKREIRIDYPFSIKKIYASVGDSVKKGQIIAEINKNDLINKLTVSNALNNNIEIKSLISGISNYPDKIKSPINGILTKLNFSEGQEINCEIPFFVISDLDNQIIKANVPESIIKNIYEGQNVSINVNSNNKTVNGTVKKIHPTGEKDDKNLNTFVTVDVKAKSYEFIKPSYSVNVKFESGNQNKIIVIPFDCIVFDEDRPYVYLNKYGFAVKRYVELGEEFETEAEIINGLKENEKVILNPKIDNITEGCKLSVIK